MREIKFRAMINTHSVMKPDYKWKYGSVVIYSDGSAHIHDEAVDREFTGKNYPIDSETVGQYTGLKDKNGKEVWEGDIVEEKEEGEIFIYEIKVIEDRYTTGWGIGYRNVVEVIGNIYEAPELLKSDQGTSELPTLRELAK